MAVKLDDAKIRWIVRQKKNGMSDAAEQMHVSARHVRRIWARAGDGSVPKMGTAGRRPRRITFEDIAAVRDAFLHYRCGAVALEKILDEKISKHILHNTIYHILAGPGYVDMQKGAPRKKPGVRYERTYSNSMWHTDWYQIKDERWKKKWLIVYEDDASRFVTGYGIFGHATSKNALEVFKRAIKKHGRPASVLTDRGTQFYATESEEKAKGATEFEKFLVKYGIRHILSRVNHPQTNGKVERLFGELNRKSSLFADIAEFVHWWNGIKPHMSLDWNNLEMPIMAYVRKTPKLGVAKLEDDETGEQYCIVGKAGRRRKTI